MEKYPTWHEFLIEKLTNPETQQLTTSSEPLDASTEQVAESSTA